MLRGPSGAPRVGRRSCDLDRRFDRGEQPGLDTIDRLEQLLSLRGLGRESDLARRRLLSRYTSPVLQLADEIVGFIRHLDDQI
jgi:hypothetical protein